MAKYLTQEWLDEYRALAKDQPVREGATAHVQYVITDGPDGTVAYHWSVVDGRLVDAQLGTLPDPDFTWTATYAVQSSIQRGELDGEEGLPREREPDRARRARGVVPAGPHRQTEEAAVEPLGPRKVAHPDRHVVHPHGSLFRIAFAARHREAGEYRGSRRRASPR